MNEVVLKTYVFSSIIIAATDIILGMKSIKKNKTTGRFLGLACIGAAIVDVSYLISIISDSYMAMSVMSSIYFVSIDYIFRKHRLYAGMSAHIYCLFYRRTFFKVGKSGDRCMLFLLSV